MTKPRLGFIGIGIMGEAMTRRLLEEGFAVTVWNREPQRIAKVEPFGAKPAPSPQAVTAASDIVLMCVLNTEAVEACVFGPNGIAAAAQTGQYLIDLSTADPAATRDMAARLRRDTRMGWIDAPVSGGPDASRTGTLTIMAGGEAADFEAVRPVLSALAANLTHMGPSGAGQTAKILNQAIVGAGFVLMAEALALAEAAGIEAARLPDCLAGGLADSALLRRIYPQMQKRAFAPPKSHARQLLKDLKAVKEFAHGYGLDLPIVETATERYATFVEQGSAMRDSAAIIGLYEKEQ